MTDKHPTCRSCNAPIRWAYTTKGKRIPLDVEPRLNGNIEIDTANQAIVVKPEPDVARWTSHFATCPMAAKHRKRK